MALDPLTTILVSGVDFWYDVTSQCCFAGVGGGERVKVVSFAVTGSAVSTVEPELREGTCGSQRIA